MQETNLIKFPVYSPVFSKQDIYWMQQALEQAKLAQAQGEVPVGAILVAGHQLIGAGYNAPISLNDPTAHAEIQAIRQACKILKNYRLPEKTTLYVTLEPCTQCVGALIHARVEKVIFATLEPRAGSLVSARNLLTNGFYNHYFSYAYGCLAEESSTLLKHFFKSRRIHKKSVKIGVSN